jgi:hypothetical protein
MLAEEVGAESTVVETDSLVPKQALQNSTRRLATIGGVICETQVLLATNFSSFVIEYVPRSCNMVAHALVAIGCKCPPSVGLRLGEHSNICHGPRGQ